MATQVHPAAVAEGQRSVSIAAPVRGSMIVTGDHNTVEMRLTGVGAVLAFVFRWDRPHRRRRRTRRHVCPPCFDDHVDRQEQVDALLPVDGSPRVVNVYGSQGIGKTHVLVEALNRSECAMRHGTVYLDGRDRSADDLLHAVFDELYECRVQRRDLRIERLLSSRRAAVALEDVELSPDDAQRLVLGAPRCRFLVTSRCRVLFDATPVSLAGLSPEHSAVIAEQELGRPLGPQERAAAESIAARLHGHPLELRQAFSRARDEGRGRPLDELELQPWLMAAPTAAQRLATLTPQQLRAARALAVHGDAALGDEHLRTIAGAEAAAAVAELESRHDATSHSPRHSLVGLLAQTLPQADLAAETDRALEHFIAWAETHAADSETLLRDATALLALLESARRARRWAEIIRLGRAIEGAYALGQRWAAWGRVLDLVLEAARHCEDLEAEGWARHQLGTRCYGLGQLDEARALLQEALALRERIDDSAGAAATRQNLRVISGPRPLLYRLSHVSLVIVAIIGALLIGAGGVGAAEIFTGNAHTAVTELVVGVQGHGSVVSDDRSLRCAEPVCRDHRAVDSELLLRPQPRRGWEFAGWSNACSGGGTCRLVLTADTRVGALFTHVREPREVTVSVQGKGTVVSHPAGIACHAHQTRQATFTRSRTLAFTAAAAPGHRFAGWSRDCHGIKRCITTAASRQTVIHARFVADPKAVALMVDVRGDGHGRVVSRQSGIDCGALCAASFRYGTRVLLRAATQPGSRFAGWNERGCGTANTCMVTLDRRRNVVARFNQLRNAAPRPKPTSPRPPPANPRRLTVVISGHGSVDSDPARIELCARRCSAAFPRGQAITLTATASTGSTFTGWIGGDCSQSTDNDRHTCTIRLDRPQTITARFTPRAPDTRILAVTATGSGKGRVTSTPAAIDCGSICGAAFRRGETITLTATGIASDFAGWRGAGCSGTGPCVVTLHDAQSVEARFEPQPPARRVLTVIPTGRGTGNVVSKPPGIDCGQTCKAAVGQGQQVALTAAADGGSTFVGWSGAGCSGTDLCVVTLDAAQTVQARFEPEPSVTAGLFEQRP